MSSLTFSFLNQDNRAEIVALRKEVFNEYYGASVDEAGLEWNKMDQASVHLGIFNSNELVSCLRLSFFKDFDTLENTTLITIPPDFQTPAALLARAATKKDFLYSGLHSLLRCRALEVCAQHKIFNILGSLEERSLRKAQLLELGYKIVGSSPGWKNSYLKNTGNVILIALKGEIPVKNAIEKLVEKCKTSGLSTWPSEINFL